jgi:hypothetical protein
LPSPVIRERECEAFVSKLNGVTARATTVMLSEALSERSELKGEVEVPTGRAEQSLSKSRLRFDKLSVTRFCGVCG